MKNVINHYYVIQVQDSSYLSLVDGILFPTTIFDLALRFITFDQASLILNSHCKGYPAARIRSVSIVLS